MLATLGIHRGALMGRCISLLDVKPEWPHLAQIWPHPGRAEKTSAVRPCEPRK